MKQELTQAIANSAGTLVASSGIVTILLKAADNHAAGIGAISTIFFGLCYLYFQWSSNKKLSVAEVNEIRISCVIEELEDHKEVSNSRFDSIDNQLASIINKLG